MADFEITPGYDALMNGVGLIDLSSRGRIRVTGDDRARLLHAMTTNHIQQMKPGDRVYAFFLNAQGRILADVHALCFEDHFLLDTEPETRAVVMEHLDRYIIADDVTLEDITDETFCLALEGPGATMPDLTEVNIAPLSFTGATAFRVYGAAARKEEIVQLLEASGAIAASEKDAETARIHRFKPRYGKDIGESTLPQETQQMQALHFQKGCYLGQEIVERIRSRGHVNKHLMGFRLEGHALPASGAIVIAGGKESGEVTSAIEAPEGNVYGLAYIRVPYDKPGAIVGIDGRPAELFAPAQSI